MRNKTRSRALALLLSLVLLLGLLPTAAFAAGGNTIYTDMSYKGQEDGTESRPYANFEDAVAKAQDGDTIVIKGKAYANVREESGVSPLIIDKRVTVTGYHGAAGELYVRAGGIVLGADVTMTDVELNLANKYHNAIFANGYSFTANNVTRGSGSREVHLYAGGISAGISGIDALPASGSSAVLTLTNSTFGNIYAGGMAVGVDGDVSIIASGSALGSVYASGTQENAPDGNWFDTSEPAAPEAWSQYRVTGSVRVTTDGSSITTVDNMAKPGVSVTVDNAWESRVLNLTYVDALTVNGGKATVASVNDTAAVTVSGNASIDLSRLNDSTIGSLTGEGTLILDKTQTLTITNAFDGTWAFETVNGFNGKSGVAEYGHTYITAGSGNANVSFAPHSTQSDMTLEKNGNDWKTSDAPAIPEVVLTFAIDGAASKTLDVNEIGQENSYIPVRWTSPAADPDNASLTAIPFRYVVTSNGQEYPATSQDGEAVLNPGDGNTLILGGTDKIDWDPDSYDGIQISGSLSAGIYQIAIFAPSADGSEIRQDFTLIVTDGTTKTATAITVTAQNAEFGATFSAAASVQADGSEIAGAALEYWLNGKQLTGLDGLKVLPENGFLLGENELRVVYAGDDTHAPSVATAAFTVSKPAATITGYTPLADGPFTGRAYTVMLNNPQIEANGTVLNASPGVTVEYKLNGQPVSAAVFPGTYTVALKTEGAETYDKIEQDIGSFTIEKAAPTVTVNAEDKGNGVVYLTVTVTGIDPYTPTGKVFIRWGDKTLEVALNGGAGSYQVTDAEATLTTYKASYAGDTNYAAADSAEGTITPSGAVTPVKGTVTADLFDFAAPALTFNGGDQTAAIKGAVTVKADFADKVGEITVIIRQSDAETEAQNAGTYDVYVTVTEGTEYEALTQPLKLGSVTIDPKTITAADFTQGENPTYTGSEQAAPITAKNGLAAGQDYELTGTATLTDVAAADVTVTVTGKGNYTGTVEFTWNLKKAAVTGEPSYTAITGSGKTLGDAGLTIGSLTPAGGTLRWVLGEDTAVQANTRYEWEYIPADQTNYEKRTGSIELWHQQQSGGGSSGGSVRPTYTVTAEQAEGGKLSLSTGRAAAGTTVTVTVTPDEGFRLASLTVRDGNGNSVAVTAGANNTYSFTMPSGRVSISAVFEANGSPIQFKDVKETDYFYAAVQWAVEKGVTEGTSATTFSPNATCTRAQMVTFLWRAAGAPEPQSAENPFTDVSPDAYYYKAVLWAIEQGITVGTSAETFSPDATVTRAQTVTFLARAAKAAETGSSRFKDVADNAYYANAVRWAEKNNVTTGTGEGKFSPDADCTRAQIVTFLWRAYSGE